MKNLDDSLPLFVETHLILFCVDWRKTIVWWSQRLVWSPQSVQPTAMRDSPCEARLEEAKCME